MQQAWVSEYPYSWIVIFVLFNRKNLQIKKSKFSSRKRGKLGYLCWLSHSRRLINGQDCSSSRIMTNCLNEKNFCSCSCIHHTCKLLRFLLPIIFKRSFALLNRIVLLIKKAKIAIKQWRYQKIVNFRNCPTEDSLRDKISEYFNCNVIHIICIVAMSPDFGLTLFPNIYICCT